MSMVLAGLFKLKMEPSILDKVGQHSFTEFSICQRTVNLGCVNFQVWVI